MRLLFLPYQGEDLHPSSPHKSFSSMMLDTKALSENPEAVIQAMECLERCKARDQAEKLVRQILDCHGRTNGAPFHCRFTSDSNVQSPSNK
jgi:hypothetical protein